MDTALIAPITAGIISCATLIIAGLSYLQSSKALRNKTVEERLATIERELKDCTAARNTLQQENIALLKDLIRKTREENHE